MAEFDSRAFRDTMGEFCTGVVIVTGHDNGQLVGFAAQSFVSLSLAPPLVSISPAKTSTSWPRLRRNATFGINMLAADQQQVSDAFAQSGQAADTPWRKAAGGAPILAGAVAFVECALDAEHDAGDHTIAVGRVLGFETLREGAPPLLYHRGGYRI